MCSTKLIADVFTNIITLTQMYAHPINFDYTVQRSILVTLFPYYMSTWSSTIIATQNI